jgi:hypothetical protein
MRINQNAMRMSDPPDAIGRNSTRSTPRGREMNRGNNPNTTKNSSIRRYLLLYTSAALAITVIATAGIYFLVFDGYDDPSANPLSPARPGVSPSTILVITAAVLIAAFAGSVVVIRILNRRTQKDHDKR